MTTKLTPAQATIASTAEAEAGTATDKFMTPDKVAEAIAALAAIATAEDLTATGYVTLSNGLIIQWGSATNTSSGGTVISYPIAFTTVFAVTGTSSLGDNRVISITPLTGSTFRMYARIISTGGATSDGTMTWIAVGI